ncbi:hypothetical protein B0H21DRAFT_719236 [Amylocystis lapponica]|nr:hypothetical protein B0H21DRAFT_719236 [Amylocystis lapponica]
MLPKNMAILNFGTLPPLGDQRAPQVVLCDGPGCTVRKSSETPLRKCEGCVTAEYCSRQCQKNGWPSHRDSCRRMQAMRGLLSPDTKLWSDAQGWLARNRTPLFNAMIAAMNLCQHPQAHEESALCVQLDYLPQEKSARKRFRLKEAVLSRWKDILNIPEGHKRDGMERMRASLKENDTQCKSMAIFGAGCVIVHVNLEGEGEMAIDAFYRISPLDLMRRPVYDRASWKEQLRQDIEANAHWQRRDAGGNGAAL